MPVKAKIKRGTMRDDGRMFWAYSARCIDGEYWVAPEKFASLKAKLDANYKKNKAKYLEGYKRRRAADPERHRGYERAYRDRHRERERRRLANYAVMNREKVRETKRRHKAMKRACPLFRIKDSIGARLRIAIAAKGFTKTSRTHQMLGCDWRFFKAYIEARFQPDMTWENYGDWHIDHRIPLASATTAEEVHRLSHYSNLQPLWAAENYAKGAKLLS